MTTTGYAWRDIILFYRLFLILKLDVKDVKVEFC